MVPQKTPLYCYCSQELPVPVILISSASTRLFIWLLSVQSLLHHVDLFLWCVDPLAAEHGLSSCSKLALERKLQ